MAKYENYDTDGEGPEGSNKSPYTRKDRRATKRNPWPSEDKFPDIPEYAVPDWLRQYIKDMHVWDRAQTDRDKGHVPRLSVVEVVSVDQQARENRARGECGV